jgi:hypothetical protein
MTDSRALSTPVNYALVLAIVTILASGLLLAATGYLADREEETTHAELTVIGDRIAADLVTMDRLARSTDGDGTVTYDSELPRSVAGRPYTVTIEPPDGDDYRIRLTGGDDVTVTVPVRSATPIVPGDVDGGDLRYTSDGTSIEVGRG